MTDTTTSSSGSSEDSIYFENLVADRYKLLDLIGGGAFGSVYRAKDTENVGKYVAVKLALDPEATMTREAEILKKMPSSAVPKLWWVGQHVDRHAIVMECLGPSLQSIHSQYDRLSLRTVALMAEHIIDALQHLHQLNWVHRDVTPSNILIGGPSRQTKFFLVDFGLASLYRCNHRNHVTQTSGLPFVGTRTFASRSAHNGLTQGRRDDLESLAYTIIYLVNGSLPWYGYSLEETGDIKNRITAEALCEGLHPQILELITKLSREMKFTELPDYNHLKHEFRNLERSMAVRRDVSFEWERDTS